MRLKYCLIVVAVLLGSTPLAADDLTGSDRFLCSATQALGCIDGAECYAVALRDINLPEFIEIDLEQGTLSTTEASKENRTTVIQHQAREDGLLYLQGLQLERAFSIVIGETTGRLSATIVTDGIGVVVFGVCTPMPTSS